MPDLARDGRHSLRQTLSAVLATLLATVLLVGASGCSYFFPQPPADLVDNANAATAALADLEGVESAEADVSSRDIKDHAHDWIVTITVTASTSSGLTTVPIEIARELGRFDLWDAYSVNASLTTPADHSVPETTVANLCLSFEQPSGDPGFRSECTTEADLETLDMVRRLEGATSAGYFPEPDGILSVTFEGRMPHPAVSLTQRVRSLPGFGSGALTVARVGWTGDGIGDKRAIEVSTTGPSAEVIEALDEIAARPGVRSLSAQELLQGNRPSISVVSAEYERDAQTLIDTPDPAADGTIRPHTSFSVVAPAVRSNTADPQGSRQAYGFVGIEGSLRTGSDVDSPIPAPDDGWANSYNQLSRPGTTAAPAPPAQPLSPAELPPAERETLDRALAPYAGDLLGFLSEASANAGVAPATPPTPEFTDCSAIEAGPGYRLTAHVMLPVWSLPAETNESVNAKLAAVTGAWSEAGMYASDRALGLDAWTRGGRHPGGTSRTLPEGILGATIRGSAEGFSITVYSRCET